jgi:hypothetical protein
MDNRVASTFFILSKVISRTIDLFLSRKSEIVSTSELAT